MLSKVAQNIKHVYLTFQTFKRSEPISSLIGLFDFVMALQAIHNLVQTYYFKDREVTELYQEFPEWKQNAFKIADLSGNLSLLLDGITSWPVIKLGKWTAQKILTPDQLTRFFGQNGLLPAEKIQASLITIIFILSIPATLKLLYTFSMWVASQFYPEERVYIPVPVDEVDMVVTVKAVSRTAQRMILNSPRR